MKPAVAQHMKGRERDALKQWDDDLRSVLQTPHGRRVIWRLISGGFTPGRPGALGMSYAANADTNFNEGCRYVAVSAIAEAQRVAPELYVTMFQEQVRAKREDEFHREQAAALRDPEDP